MVDVLLSFNYGSRSYQYTEDEARVNEAEGDLLFIYPIVGSFKPLLLE